MARGSSRSWRKPCLHQGLPAATRQTHPAMRPRLLTGSSQKRRRKALAGQRSNNDRAEMLIGFRWRDDQARTRLPDFTSNRGIVRPAFDGHFGLIGQSGQCQDGLWNHDAEGVSDTAIGHGQCFHSDNVITCRSRHASAWGPELPRAAPIAHTRKYREGSRLLRSSASTSCRDAPTSGVCH